MDDKVITPPATSRPRNSAGPEQSGLANNVATAPGDLPVAEVQQRAFLQREQFRHDNTIWPLSPRRGEPVQVEATAGERMPLRAAAVYYTTDGSEPHAGSASVPMERASVKWDMTAGFLTHWRAEIPPQPEGTAVRYRIGGWREAGNVAVADEGKTEPDIWAHDGQGFWFRVPWPAGVSTFAYLVQAEEERLPDWAAEGAIYHIFVDRFHPGTPDGKFGSVAPRDFHGGTLRGITRSLPYLTELGITCIWLSPICEAPSYHRYDATDFYKVDPRVGGDEALRELVDQAHANGIRVVLDYVPSHCSSSHPAFVAAQRNPQADSFSWFTFYTWPDSYRNFLDRAPRQPSFNTDDPGARQYLIGSAVHWMRDFGVDGYRIDHVIGPSMDFWVALRTATDAADPQSLLFGEATDTPDSLRRYRGRLHGVLDFPLAQALRHLFALGDWDIAHFASYLDSYERFMEVGPGRLSFLDNHDMNRFLFLAGGDTNRLKLAALCQFTLRGTPIIYYGTEVGLSHEHAIEARGMGGDSLARADMPWDPALWDEDLLAFYRTLIQFRREHPSLSGGSRRTIYLDPEAGVLGYVRSAGGADESRRFSSGDLLVFFNLSNGPRSLALPGHSGERLLPVLQTGPELAGVQTEGGQVAITLPAESGVVLRVERY